MYKLNLGCSIDCFGLQKFEDGSYEITKLHDYVDEMTRSMKENGFNSMELSAAGAWNLKEEEENFPCVKEFVKIIRKNGIKLNSVHLPFSLPFWEFASIDEASRKLTVERAKWAISQFEEGEPKYFVIHPGRKFPENAEERKQMLKNLEKSMQELCDSTNAVICIENMTSEGLLNQTSEALELLRNVPKLQMCIDINHMFIETPQEYIEKIGDRIKAIHVSDRDEVKERHMLPGDGILEWNKILGALDKVGYSGEFTYEISIRRRQTPFSVVRENFETLFNNYNSTKN